MKLREKPMEIDKHNWYYEEEKGIILIHEVMDKMNSYLRTDTINIPWKRLLESVRRKYPKQFKR